MKMDAGVAVCVGLHTWLLLFSTLEVGRFWAAGLVVDALFDLESSELTPFSAVWCANVSGIGRSTRAGCEEVVPCDV